MFSLRRMIRSKQRPEVVRRKDHRVSRAARTRRATATVEMAVLTPVLLTFTFGTLDLCTLQFLRESAVLAAYEGARQGVARNRTNADVTARVQQFLDERNIEYNNVSVVQFSQPGFGNAETLEPVTVTVNIPAGPNLLVPSALVGDMTVSVDVTMAKEWKNQ